MSSGKTICKHGSEPFDCRFCRTDENKMVVAITDGPIAVENLTIDQRYRFLQMIHLKDKEIARLRAALEDIRAEVDDDGDDGHGGYLLDVCREALAGGE